MKFIGLDLAGNPKNDTGFCILEIKDDKRIVTTSILHSDQEILDRIKANDPEMIAIDAPLTYCGMNRKCDEDLREYGALPVTLKGMEVLARRGTDMTRAIGRMNYKAIEVYATASAKILGFYEKDEALMQKKLMGTDLEGALHKRMLKRDELDAVFCALTAYLACKGAVEEVGDEAGKITIPLI
ncbi:MAG: DUF429 domain-containing protein [Candidatus Altiarchaeota archaeon]|nr:DUF429 domain-containing protein [Candidatus Altiarchaeota archaeon]